MGETMKNIINYYYNFNLLDVYLVDNKYFFNYKNNDYFFIVFDRPIDDVQSIYNLFLELKKRRLLTNDIILNKDNQIITFVNNTPYILIKDNVKNKQININDILYIQNNTINVIKDKKLYRNNWINMWKAKIDYYEQLMNNISNKYKILNNTIDYYIGLGENAISYLVNNKITNNILCLSHKRIDVNKNSFDFYNPINYILDNRVRDFSEYTKNLFFLGKISINNYKYFLEYMNFTREEYILLISRLLFPTYFFDMYDNIINYNLDEIVIEDIINNTDNYISFIRDVMMYIIYQKRINIPFIEWIIKDA